MRQTIKIGVVLLVALTVSLGYTMISNSKKNDGQMTRLVTEKEQMAKDLSDQEANFNLIMELVTEVEEQIESIAKKENLVINTKPGEYMGGKQKLLKEIAMIDDLVNRSHENIESLAGKLKTVGLKSTVLQKKVQRLTGTLQEKVDLITELKADLATKDENLKVLSVKVDDLEKEGALQAIAISQKDSEIDQLTASNNELNKVHFAVGSFADLEAKGLVKKEGGFLFFGRKTGVYVESSSSFRFLHSETLVVKIIPSYYQVKVVGYLPRMVKVKSLSSSISTPPF